MEWFYYLAAAGFGLIFGSFFNVCICRIPEGESLGQRSHCQSCGATIRWYDNVPLLSFLLLGGRCRRCGRGISLRYPVVEALTAAVFVATYWWSRSVVPGRLEVPKSLLVPELFIGLLMASVLIVAATIDISCLIVPNRVVYPGLVAMLVLVTGVALYRGEPARIGIAVATAVVGSGLLLGIGLAYGSLFMKRSASNEGGQGVPEPDGTPDDAPEGYGGTEPLTGVGMGDVKLLAFIGLALGYFHWYLVLLAVLFAAVLGALAAVIMRTGRKERLPFAPFLSAGAYTALIAGLQIIEKLFSAR